MLVGGAGGVMLFCRRAVSACDGNRAQAAEQLGIRRQLLYQKLERYGLALSANRTGHVPEADSHGPAQQPPG